MPPHHGAQAMDEQLDNQQGVSGSPKILGGYFITARKMLDGMLMDWPPLYMKLWVWMLSKAFWKDGEKFKRGQFHTNREEMQEAMSYKIGYRKKTPTKDEIRSAYEAFTKATMITTVKATHGMIISICNYSYYQDFKNYEAHNEAHNETPTKPTVVPQYREGRLKKESKTYDTKPKRPVSPDSLLLSEFFEQLWKAYPKKVGKEEARKHYHASVKSEVDMDRINIALGRYLGDLKENEDWKSPQDGNRWFKKWNNWEPEKND